MLIKTRQTKKLGQPRLLIVGCGDIGARIVARLRTRFRVFAVTTSAERVATLRGLGAVPLLVNLDHAHAALRLSGLAQRAIHLAPPPNQGTRDPRTRRLVAATRDDAMRWVYVSTTGVYGDREGALIDETAQPQPHNERAVRRVDAEQQMRRALRARVLRVPGIYAHDRLPLERLHAGTPALSSADDVFTNHIHGDDLARLCIAALWHAKPARVYNAVDDTQLKMGDYFDAVADRFQLPRPPRLPRTELKAAVSPMMYSFMSESRRLANRRIKRELRVRLLYPTVAATLASL